MISAMAEQTEGNRLVLTMQEQSRIQGLQAADIPYHLWENTLVRLPISNPFRMLSVCTAWNSMVQSDSVLMAYKRVYDSRSDSWKICGSFVVENAAHFE
jgi:hypothetical protein